MVIKASICGVSFSKRKQTEGMDVTGAARKRREFFILKRKFELIASANIPTVNVSVATRRPKSDFVLAFLKEQKVPNIVRYWKCQP